MSKSVLCMWCIHYKSIKKGEKIPRCTAFPDGIPEPIFLGRVNHRLPHPDDNGIQFEPVDTLKGDEEETE